MVAAPHAVTSLLIITLIERLRFALLKDWLRLPDPRPKYRRWPWVTATMSACFFSHFLLDSIPHYDYALKGNDPISVHILLIDLLFGLSGFAFVFWQQIRAIAEGLPCPIANLQKPDVKEKFRHIPLLITALSGIFFAWLPDMLLILFGPSQNVIFYYFKMIHGWAHNSWMPPVLIGCYIQTAIYIGCAMMAKWQIEIIEAGLKIEKNAMQIGEEFEFRFILRK